MYDYDYDYALCSAHNTMVINMTIMIGRYKAQSGVPQPTQALLLLDLGVTY